MNPKYNKFGNITLNQPFNALSANIPPFKNDEDSKVEECKEIIARSSQGESVKADSNHKTDFESSIWLNQNVTEIHRTQILEHHDKTQLVTSQPIKTMTESKEKDVLEVTTKPKEKKIKYRSSERAKKKQPAFGVIDLTNNNEAFKTNSFKSKIYYLTIK